jgi:hypothetical protein
MIHIDGNRSVCARHRRIPEKQILMRHLLVLVFIADTTEWAHEYGLTEAQAADDFASAVGHAVDDGGVRSARDAAWPMMRGHVAVYTVDDLDPAVRDDLLHHLDDARHANQSAALLAEIRARLSAHPSDVDDCEAFDDFGDNVRDLLGVPSPTPRPLSQASAAFADR